MLPVNGRHILLDSPPPPFDAWRIRASRCISPDQSRMRYHSESGTSTSTAASYGCRAGAGFPPAVRLPSLAEMAPNPPPQGGPKRR